ncbi:MAG: M61 family metallopeptidase [Candidatus Aminicenantales bacterium]
MKLRIRIAFLLFFGLIAAAAASFAPADGAMAFTVSMEQPNTHLYHVVLRCDGLKGETQDFKIPVWMPGYYGIIDYAGKIQNFKVENGSGAPLAWEKSSANSWKVRTGNAPSVTVSYDVLADIQFIVNSYLDENRAYIAPVGVFMHVGGLLAHPVTVTVEPYAKWTGVVTGLDPVPGKPNTFSAPDFDVLYDCPILAGNLDTVSFEVRGVPHRFVGWNLGEFDRTAFASDMKRMVEAAVGIVGEIPYTHYTFLSVGPGQGGIEHTNSTAVSLGGLGGERGYRGSLGFLAHEYFHLYNVKTIRPIELGPFDYDKANRTRLLWVSEGFTSYYQNLILRRAGLTAAEDSLRSFGSTIAGLESRPGRLVQTAAESSWASWDQGPFGGDPDKAISYYEKGAVIGLLLDFKIRHETKNAKSLDDVMKTLYREYYKEKKRGFSESELREVCERIAGAPLDEIFEYANTVKAIDYPKYLAFAGLTASLPRELDEADLGAAARDMNGKLIVGRIDRNSPAGRAGLAARDEILALDGARVDARAMDALIAAKNPGDTVKVRYAREGKEAEIAVALGKKIDRGYRLTRVPDPDPLQAAIYKDWMRE